MTDRELMQQALYALGLAKSSHNMMLSSDPPQSAWRYYDVDRKLQETITALDKRLAQPEQEHTSFMDSKINPIQRLWVGLTDDELESMAEQYVTDCYFDTLKYGQSIQSKLKEKNK